MHVIGWLLGLIGCFLAWIGWLLALLGLGWLLALLGLVNGLAVDHQAGVAPHPQQFAVRDAVVGSSGDGGVRDERNGSPTGWHGTIIAVVFCHTRMCRNTRGMLLTDQGYGVVTHNHNW